MAQFYPKYNDIESGENLTYGEENLLTFFKSFLDDKFEIFYKPYINGDNPTIVLLKENSGAFIFEVFDSQLSDFEELLKSKEIPESERNNEAKSPISKLYQYKENLFNLHIDRLLEYKIKDNSHWKVINCGIYFNNIILKELDYIKHSPYFEFIGKDSLNNNFFTKLLNRNGLNSDSEYFKDVFYKSFLRYLKPPFHKIEDGIDIEYTKKQEALIQSQAGYFLITGFAGSGKTLVLAKRAVNAHIRTKETILILTYNKSLVNYIHDKIDQVKENFSWSSFYIVNYHQLIKTVANNKNQKLNGITAFQNESFFQGLNIDKYQTIIIDEVQDYETSWIRIIKNHFLKEDGELVVFGDEKQDIYERKSINKSNTGIKFKRSKLNQNQRFSKKLNNLLLLYQNYFFLNKYEIDKIDIDINQTIDYNEYSEFVDYFNFKGDFNIEMIYQKIEKDISTLNVHPSDIAILSARADILIELDYHIRKDKHEKTSVIFERKEIREKLAIDISEHNKRNTEEKKQRNLSKEIDVVRDYKKQHFSMDDKVMKLSTIHSFKGWDIHTLFLIIENDIDTKLITDELIYVGLTRGKRNLIILNLGSKWHPITGVPRDYDFGLQKAWHLPDNIQISNGTLKITANKFSTPYTGTWVTDWSTNPPTEKTSTFEYSTAEIWSNYKFGHGKFEIRCKLPKGKGFFPAFWTYGGPEWNEIDIFEFWNEYDIWGNFDENKLSKYHKMTSHYDGDGDGQSSNCPTKYKGPDFSQSFHTFTVIWTPYKLEWYVDGVLKRVSTFYYTELGQIIDCNGLKAYNPYILDMSFFLENQ